MTIMITTFALFRVNDNIDILQNMATGTDTLLTGCHALTHDCLAFHIVSQFFLCPYICMF